MKLRSKTLSKEDSSVDVGHKSRNLKRVKLPDLNLNDESNAVSSEGEEGKSNGSMCEGGVKGLMSDCCRVLNGCSQKNGVDCGILEKDGDVSGDGKDLGVVKSNGDVGLANEGSLMNLEATVEGVVEHIDDTLSYSVNEAVGLSENGKHDGDGKKVIGEYDVDLDLSLKSNCGEVVENPKRKFGEGDRSERLKSETKEGSFHVFDKVLRSRVVPAKRLGEEASVGHKSAPPFKKKRGFDTMKDDVSITSSENKKKRGRPKKSISCSVKEVEVIHKNEKKAVKVSKKSVESSTDRRKSERSKKTVSYCETEVIQRKKLSSVSIIKYESEDKDKCLSNTKDACSTKMGKRGRPKKQETSSPVKMKSSDKKMTVGCEETSKKENKLSVENKKGEIVGSTAAEKNSIRNQISELLMRAGWTIQHRPRNGREYSDAVYLNRKGQTHWSVTKAYFSLQREFEGGKTPIPPPPANFTFTPLPEELLRRLFRNVSKTRSDKKKKKKNKQGENDCGSSDEDGIKAKRGSKNRLSVRVGAQSKRRCALVARRSKGVHSKSDQVIAYMGKHSILAWLIDSGAVSADSKVKYMNDDKSESMLEGKITRDGIYCHCCKKLYSVFELEKHSGSKLNQPYKKLLLESGQSLLECMLDSWNKQDEASIKGFHSVNVDDDDSNDDTCAICGDGGDLMCCDGCPSTFHQDCLNIEEFPSGDWHCVYCSCKFCGEVGSQVIDGCDTVLSPLATCCLCQEKYHISCANEGDKSGRATFCGKICEQIFEKLQMLIGIKSDLGDGYSWTILQRLDLKETVDSFDAQKIEINSKLAIAMSVMDECFVPIIDPRSSINFIRHVVYNFGSNLMRINFSSFFTIVLEKGDEIISAAPIRIHGMQLAEMPFIGTRNIYRRKGMCRRLLTAIELALGSLDVKNLVIPAIPELLDTWTSVFGFQPLKESIREEMRSMNMVVFAHTDMLQKSLSKQTLVEKSEVDDGNFNASFDLNTAASSVPDPSSDEIPASNNAEICSPDESTNTTATKEAQPTEIEVSDKIEKNSGVAVVSSEECMISDHPEPSCAEKGFSMTALSHGNGALKVKSVSLSKVR